MGTSVRVRSRSMQTLGAAIVGLAAIGLVSVLFGGIDDLFRFGATLALLGLAGWAAFWQPHVEVSDGGVTVTNTLRTIHVPWPALDGVDGRYGLKLTTAYGSVTAWAAAAPVGRQRAREQHSRASAAVNQRWQELSDAGHLTNPRLERPRLIATWHRTLIGVVLVLLVAAVLPLVS